MKLLGISGSLRKSSYNTALLRAAVGLMPDGAQLEAASIHGIPLYDGDLEASQGIPAAVGRDSQSMAFLNGPGMELLYSGVAGGHRQGLRRPAGRGHRRPAAGLARR